MQTDKIMVSANGAGWNEALEEAAKFAAYVGLDKKAAMRVRLMTEEAISLIESVAGDFAAELRIESDKNCAVRLFLKAQTDMDFVKRKELIDVSTEKKNAAAKGILGKIRQVIENCLYSVDEVSSLTTEYGGAPLMYGTMGMYETDPGMAMSSMNYMWSLGTYKDSVETAMDSDDAAKEAWDELEKSIIASIADDVKVGVSGNTVELVIEKKNF